jgi:hypothetical protein
VLEKLPKSLLREIWLPSSRAAAETAMATFAEKYAPKYDDAVKCLLKDRDALLTFFDFSAEHWVHLRTSNPIESVFATVRKTVRTKGALSLGHCQDHGVHAHRGRVENLAPAERSKSVAETRWRRKIQGRNRSRRRNEDRRLIPSVTHFPA